MPVDRSSSRLGVVVGASWRHLDGERGGVDDAVVLEVEEQAVAAGGGKSAANGHVAGRLVAVVRVDVQVGEVALAQRDEVAAGAEVGLEASTGRPVAGDGEVEVAPPCRRGARSCCRATVEAVGGRRSPPGPAAAPARRRPGR